MRYCLLTRKLLFIYAIQSVCGGTAFYISLFLNGHAQLNPVQIGLALSLGSAGNIAGGYIGGFLCDKFNASYNLRIGLLIQGSALFSLIFLQKYEHILIIMMLMGFGSYLYVTSSNYILNSKFNIDQQNRTKIISDQHIISNIGMFLAAILMGYSTDGYYSVIFAAISITLVVIAILIKPFSQTNFEEKGYESSHLDNFLVNNYLYLLGIGTIGVVGLLFASHRIGFPIYLDENFGNISTGFLMALNPLIILLFQKTIIRFSTKNEVLSIAIGLALFALSFLTLNFSPTFLIVLLSIVFLTVGEILTVTHAQSVAFGFAPKNKRGKIIGLYKATYSLTKVCGSYCSGIIIQNYSYGHLWGMSSCLGIVGGLLVLNYYKSNINLYGIYEKT
ncbi:MFS transporter [Legionella genomosp. 1]|uniref:MFS transporter n=1 Tax=Legionella genomosp. 1 TaxID=1093625 RepID=UPI0013EFC132|nr:MFS transporter [Legionella genomosp. 1]